MIEKVADSKLGKNFHIALIYAEKKLLRMMICVVDESHAYMAFLVQGIDYNNLQKSQNLYNDCYITIYKYMQEYGLMYFDMGCGFVDVKKRLGGHPITPLYTYIKPLTPNGERFLNLLTSRIKQLNSP